MGKYVYGVIPASAEVPADAAGIGGSALETVAGDGAVALVSDVPGESLIAGPDELLVHARVLEQALAHGVVLPMRFGVVMPDEEGVRRDLLDRHHDSLVAQLTELEDKVELRLRALYDETTLMREVVAENPEIARERDRLKDQPPDATYYDRIQLGELVARAVEGKRQADAERIVGRLEPLALAVDVGDPAHERVAVNASFLVERERIDEFDAAVDEIGREEDGRMRLKYTGPVPPHSFVELSGQD